MREQIGPNGEVPGTRVEIISLQDHWTRLGSGEKGTVKFIDAVGTIHCDFDNGGNLGLIYGVDRWKVIK